MRKFWRIFTLFKILPLAALITCCGGINEKTDSYFIQGTQREKEALGNLFALLSQEPEPGAERFSIVREIANEYKRIDDYNRLINFLSSWVDEHPADPFNTYYLFMTAYAYLELEAPPVSALYFNLIVKNYPDLIVRGESIHLICLQQLINLVDAPAQKIWCYEELLSRFPEQSDKGVTWFMLGQTYEQVGEWNRAIASYTQFLRYYATVVPGFPDAYAYAKQMVDFNNSSKNWTFESLDALVDTIKRNLDSGNTWRLWQYRARVNFFARSWAQADSDDSGMAEFNLSSFGSSGKLHYADSLSPGSNSNEAYLRTWGWSQFTPIWYFYFRKIYFPLDPDIHGRWEWAGVYYGERF
ncbi:MAG: tetratricopeptide repeat-containing protein [Spirochaetaceae bacterium]|jgi:tetratricopeptide (TPR) repeat protein|nr:tetratricopeptide repeat-containing protein [Spirochaetaceae bacterium]